MSLLFTSHNPSLLFEATASATTAAASSTHRHSGPCSLSPYLHPRRTKLTIIRFSSNKPATTPGWNPADRTLNDEEESDGSKSSTVTDEWGEKSDQETEPLTKLPTSDPPKDEDEWGTVAAEQPEEFSVPGSNGSVAAEVTGVEDDGEVEELKRCLVDSVYGTGLGFRASPEERAEVMELVIKLERVNPTPAPADAVELLDGNWILLYTAFSELLPLLAAGSTPLLKVDKICQEVNTRSLTIDNSITFSSPFATFTSTASADFQVRSPSRIQVEFKEGTFEPPKIKPNVSLPENVNIFGQNINLSPIKQSLSPFQEAVANASSVISGQDPLKIPIPGERGTSWLLITYLDKDLRISRGDGGLFVLAKEGSPLLDQ